MTRFPDPTLKGRRRRAVAGILAATLMFAMIFTVGVGYFLLINSSSGLTNQASVTAQSSLQQASMERLVITETPNLAVNAATSGDLWLSVTNNGGVPSTIVAIFVRNALGQNAIISPAPQYLSTSANLNVTLPVSLNIGASTKGLQGCGAPVGCDIAIQKSAFLYTSGTYLVSVLTARGNVFSAQYPPPVLATTTTSTSATTTATTVTSATGGAGGNALVVQMVATPAQVFSGATVTDTITVFNYAFSPVTTVTLGPTPPTVLVTGTATLDPGNCAPASYASIPAYSGVGIASSVVFTCTFVAHTGAVGGFASFSGTVLGTLSGSGISSAQAVSNSVLVGGTSNVLNQGPFSANFFFFRYSSCFQSSGSSYAAPCVPTPSPMPPASLNNLIDGAIISGSKNYYVAYYIQVTNNFNTTLPILDTSYFMTDPNHGGESAFYIVGTATNPQTNYFPNYNTGPGGKPTLTAYTGSAAACAETAPLYNPPPPTTCIDVAPGQTVTITFAACNTGSTYWNLGGSQYGSNFDSGNDCSPANPPGYQTPETSYLSIIISFVYKGQVYAQDLPFQGDVIIS